MTQWNMGALPRTRRTGDAGDPATFCLRRGLRLAGQARYPEGGRRRED